MEGVAMTAVSQIVHTSIVNFNGLVADLQRETGRSVSDAVAYAGGRFLQSCAATAKPGKKLRKVIANPLFKAADSSSDSRKAARAAKGDMRRARFGVMKYQQKKPAKFVPIYRTGEFGRVRFLDKKTGQMRWRSSKGTLRKEVNFDQGIEGNPNIKNDKRRVIKRAGLARKIFKIMRAYVLARGSFTTIQGDHYSLVQKALNYTRKRTVVLDMVNGLTYLTNAYPNILQVSAAAAQKGLEYELRNQIAKRTAQAINKRRAT
jgi:hypothetical protein